MCTRLGLLHAERRKHTCMKLGAWMNLMRDKGFNLQNKSKCDYVEIHILSMCCKKKCAFYSYYQPQKQLIYINMDRLSFWSLKSETALMFCYHGWISSQLSQRSWSAQLAAIWQAQTAVHGVGPDADSERETEGRQGPFCYCHTPWEAGTLQCRRIDKQSSKIISPYPPVCVQWCKPIMLPDSVGPWAVYVCFKWIYSADIMSKTSR